MVFLFLLSYNLRALQAHFAIVGNTPIRAKKICNMHFQAICSVLLYFSNLGPSTCGLSLYSKDNWKHYSDETTLSTSLFNFSLLFSPLPLVSPVLSSCLSYCIVYAFTFFFLFFLRMYMLFLDLKVSSFVTNNNILVQMRVYIIVTITG